MINSFTPGQTVLLKHRAPTKLDFRYPDKYIILKQLHGHQYLIRRMSDNFTRKANVCQLKPFHSQCDIADLPRTRDIHTQTFVVDDMIHNLLQAQTHSPNIDLPATSPTDVNLPLITHFDA